MFTSVPLLLVLFIVISIIIVARVLISNLDNKIQELEKTIIKYQDNK